SGYVYEMGPARTGLVVPASTGSRRTLIAAIETDREMDYSASEIRQAGPGRSHMSSHEQYTREYVIETASNRRFGLVVGGIFLLIGCIRAYLHWEMGWLAAILAAIGLTLMLAAVMVPDALTP